MNIIGKTILDKSEKKTLLKDSKIKQNIDIGSLLIIIIVRMYIVFVF